MVAWRFYLILTNFGTIGIVRSFLPRLPAFVFDIMPHCLLPLALLRLCVRG
jgi:hypothetical protein